MNGRGVRPEVSTTQFEFAHGHRPRGRGQWAFWVRPHRGAPDARSDLFFAPGNLLYSEARELAVCRAYDLWAGDSYAFIEVAS